MAEFERYCAGRMNYSDAAMFPWSAPVMYWIVTEMRRAMLQYNHGMAELRKVAETLLRQWGKKLQAGESIPAPVIRLEHKTRPETVGHEKGLTTPETNKKGREMLARIIQKNRQSRTNQ
ncbi:DNA replication protein [Paramixta manurensis]|uniref:DNA replication protein n=2 Tax=Paramixta manurensis TaxID=2740817 RepID=A0A6M8UKM8_9GAMM|nr:DNA replication protein [Erwiniaceae bacterium PD-1]